MESVFFVQNFVWKNYRLLLVESTSNFAWSLFWRKFTSRVIYFCQIFSASKIFVKLLFIWAGLDVFPFKMMKKEACHRVQHVKISRNWSSSFVGRLCACLKNQTFEGNEKCAQPALMLVTWDSGVSVHESAIVVMANMANTGKTVQVVRWSSRKRRVVQAPAEPATGEMIFPGPRFPQKSPQMGEGQFFPPLPQKMPILFHSGNKRQFKLSPKSVSNYQNQLVEAEKLFKKVTFLPDSTVETFFYRLEKKIRMSFTDYEVIGFVNIVVLLMPWYTDNHTHSHNNITART